MCPIRALGPSRIHRILVLGDMARKILIERRTVASVGICIEASEIDLLGRERRIQVVRGDGDSKQPLSHLDHWEHLDSCCTKQPPVRGTDVRFCQSNVVVKLRDTPLGTNLNP